MTGASVHRWRSLVSRLGAVANCSRLDFVALMAIVIVVAGTFVRLFEMIMADGVLIDDAYITLRYGHNLFSGLGLVYNVGDRVLAAPPLYIFITGFFLKLEQLIVADNGYRVGYFLTSFNIACTVLSGLLIYRLLKFEQRFLKLLPLTIFFLYVPFADNTTTGMETSSFVLFLVLGRYLYCSGKYTRAGLVLALSVLLRLEGVLWIFAIVLTELIREKRIKLSFVLPIVFFGAVWALFTTSYFGTPIPHNALAKSAWFDIGHDAENVFVHGWKVLRMFCLVPIETVAGLPGWAGYLFSGFTLLMLLFFGVGTVRLYRERHSNLVWALFFAFYIIFFIVGRGRTWPSWYVIPPGLALTIVVSYGFSSLLNWSRRRYRIDWSQNLASRLVVVTLILVFTSTSMMLWAKNRQFGYHRLIRNHGVTGEFLAKTDPDCTIMLHEIGYIGFLADRYVYDMAGIVSTEILEHRQKQWSFDPALVVNKYEPDYLVVPAKWWRQIRESDYSSWFSDHYNCVLETPMYYTFQKRPVQASS
jgi:hypothetical protein